jgi:hypothetical protein
MKFRTVVLRFLVLSFVFGLGLVVGSFGTEVFKLRPFPNFEKGAFSSVVDPTSQGVAMVQVAKLVGGQAVLAREVATLVDHGVVAVVARVVTVC